MKGPCPICPSPTGLVPWMDGSGEWFVPYCMECLNRRVQLAKEGVGLVPLPELKAKRRAKTSVERPVWMSEEGTLDWVIRDHLRAQELLAESDRELERRARENVEGLLRSVVPGPLMCSWSAKRKSETAQAHHVVYGADDETAPTIETCDRPGVRMVALTGHWFCEEHDPLAANKELKKGA